jgi:hypothetical protein
MARGGMVNAPDAQARLAVVRRGGPRLPGHARPEGAGMLMAPVAVPCLLAPVTQPVLALEQSGVARPGTVARRGEAAGRVD